jgi:hypothetical protein
LAAGSGETNRLLARLQTEQIRRVKSRFNVKRCALRLRPALSLVPALRAVRPISVLEQAVEYRLVDEAAALEFSFRPGIQARAIPA